MLETNTLKIAVTRGDTGTVTLTFTGDDTPENGTIALVTVKKNVDSEEPLWEKRVTIADGKAEVGLRSEDTDVAYGKYWWDVRLLYTNGDVYTPMKPAEFRVLEAVGDAVPLEETGTGTDAEG